MKVDTRFFFDFCVSDRRRNSPSGDLEKGFDHLIDGLRNPGLGQCGADQAACLLEFHRIGEVDEGSAGLGRRNTRPTPPRPGRTSGRKSQQTGHPGDDDGP